MSLRVRLTISRTVVSCSSEMLLMCDGAAAAPSLLSWLLLHWQSCAGLWARGNWEKDRDGVAGLVLAGLSGQHLQWGFGGHCSLVSECATTGSLVRHHYWF